MKQSKNRFTQIIITISIALSVLFASISAIIIVALDPQRQTSNENPEDYGLYYENVMFNSYIDGVLLKGWWIPAQKSIQFDNTRTVIFSHGFGDSRTGMPIKSLALADKIVSKGYNVLMYDFRNSGESEGRLTTIGHKEQHDVLSAIEFSKSKGSKKIALIGWSMGASSSILAGSLSEDVSVIIADSPFSDLEYYIGDRLNFWTKLPNELSPVIVKIATVFTGIKMNEVSPKNAAKGLQDTDKALLLIHGKKDRAISYTESVKIKDEVAHAEIWLPDESGHIRSYKKEKSDYEYRVIAFLDKHMKDVRNWRVFF